VFRPQTAAAGSRRRLRIRADDRLVDAARDRAAHPAARPRAPNVQLFTRADFTFDPQANVFTCPGGKQLTSTGLVRADGTMPYWASPKDCRACPLKPRCTKGTKRIVTRNFFEAEREYVRALRGTEAFERSARERRKIEMSFAHLKRNLGFRRLRLRGLTGAADEFLLAATVQNLKKLVRFIGDRPPTPTGCPA
jgi:Transposase DDE domain